VLPPQAKVLPAPSGPTGRLRLHPAAS